MAAFKEHVTTAGGGQGKKYFKNNYTIEASDTPTTVLGCWVINHKFKGYKTGDKIGVDGSYDVNIWYSYENDTKTSVLNKRVDYNDTFNVKVKSDADITGDTEVIVRALKQPTCSKVEILDGGIISFDIEKELGVELVGETKFKIGVEEDEEPWDEIVDDITPEEDEALDKVDENYL